MSTFELRLVIDCPDQETLDSHLNNISEDDWDDIDVDGLKIICIRTGDM